jgi:octaprenyl-diphosphate synthase
LPLLIAMHRGTAAEAATIRKAIQLGGLDELPAVLTAVKATDSLNYVRALAANEAKIGCEAIAHLPESANKQALIDLATFAVKRDF